MQSDLVATKFLEYFLFLHQFRAAFLVFFLISLLFVPKTENKQCRMKRRKKIAAEKKKKNVATFRFG